MDLWIRTVYFSDAFFPVCLFSGSLFTFPPFSSTNSEEAKSSTWLHPVTGEAVITGHRKTPGKESENGVFFDLCENTHTHARTQRLGKVIRASQWRKKGATSCGESLGRRRGEISSLAAAKQQPLLLRCPFCSPLADYYARRPPTSSCSLHLDTLRHTF